MKALVLIIVDSITFRPHMLSSWQPSAILNTLKKTST